MVKARTIAGPKERIAREIVESGDDIVEAIIFVHEVDAPADAGAPSMFFEMEQHTVNVADVDYSRESIYRPPGDG